jgi:ABC-type bacteriocin/lantibiotic exporter with double-glycine peptidase domain
LTNREIRYLRNPLEAIFLIDDKIISLKGEKPDMKRIIEIFNILQITTFIQNLPNGFGTLPGEHGVSLSGGE